MNSRRTLYVIIALGLFLLYWFWVRPSAHKAADNNTSPVQILQHSKGIDDQINQIVVAYLAMKDAFVETDTALVKKNARLFIESLGSMDTLALKKDTVVVYEILQQAILDMKSNATSILQKTDITEMRKDFSNLTEMMYPAFFTAVHYEGSTLYLQNCPMAFYDSIAANWISNSNEVINPYLGKKHPRYQSAMLNCGEVKDSIK